MTWTESAKCIPPWRGARFDERGRKGYIVGFYNDMLGRRQVLAHFDEPLPGRNGRDMAWDYSMGPPLVVDLQDPDTFRGAVARLALKLGAPEEDVAKGCLFYLDVMGEWNLSAGEVDGEPGWSDRRKRGTLDPIEALAAWWREVMK